MHSMHSATRDLVPPNTRQQTHRTAKPERTFKSPTNHKIIINFIVQTIIFLINFDLTRCQSHSELDLIRPYHAYPFPQTGRPKFLIQPEDQEVLLNTNRVQFKCMPDSSSHNQYMLYWYKEGHRQMMFQTTRNKQLNVDSHQISQMSLSNDNSNTRHAQNSDSMSPASNRLFSMPINEQVPNNQNQNYFNNRIYVDSQGTLNILDVNSNDSGYYACAIVSPVGSALSKAKLSVKTPQGQFINPIEQNVGAENSNFDGSLNLKSTRSNKFDLLPPPVIKFGSVNQTLPLNTNTSLLCEVLSLVNFKIQWQFNDNLLNDDPPRVTISDQGTLFIEPLRASDTGLYTCIATSVNDPTMSLADSSATIDSTMLTPAPPIPQSTTHSCMLKVANPLNPSINLYKMPDIPAYPSSPGPAILSTLNDDNAITISWTTPSEPGTFPIKEYIIEHYDTSQEHIGWRVISRTRKENLIVDGLSSDGSHYFVIRAANSHGSGPSSPISAPMRTKAGNARYEAEWQRSQSVSFEDSNPYLSSQSLRSNLNRVSDRLMSLTTTLIKILPITSTSVRLQWMTQDSSLQNLSGFDSSLGSNSMDLSDYVEGYSIRYRVISSHSDSSRRYRNPPIWAALIDDQYRDSEELSSPLPLMSGFVNDDSQKHRANYLSDYSYEFNEVKITDRGQTNHIVKNLLPFTYYEFFVVPYYKHIDGVPSNVMDVKTLEDKPSVAPPYLNVRAINSSSSSIKLLWLQVPPHLVHGNLKGYQIRINKKGDRSSNSALIQSDDSDQNQFDPQSPLVFPLSALLLTPAMSPANVGDDYTQNSPNYVVSCILQNLTYQAFYEVQVAAYTVQGQGPWSNVVNFVMDPEQLASNSDDLLASITSFSSKPGPAEGHPLQSGFRLMPNMYIIVPLVIFAALAIMLSTFAFYKRKNQQVPWKKTFSEHLTNKFYFPSSSSSSTTNQRSPESLQQQSIYDQQHHLIYLANPQAVRSTTIPSSYLAGSTFLPTPAHFGDQKLRPTPPLPTPPGQQHHQMHHHNAGVNMAAHTYRHAAGAGGEPVLERTLWRMHRPNE